MLFSSKNTLEEIWVDVKHEIHRGAIDRKHPFRFLTLCTVSESNPDARYVVLRAVDDALSLYIYTDYRTEKIKDLQDNNQCTLIMYHPQKRIQLRVYGQALVHHKNDTSKEHWSNVQGEAQKAYNPSISPGVSISDPQQAYEWPENLTDSYFTVLEIRPHTIDALQLNNMEHLRASFKREKDQWIKAWIAP